MGGKALALFHIPEGNKKESPTSFMSLSNQQYETVKMAEEAELKAQTAKNAPSEAKEAKAAFKMTPELEELNKKIVAQGEVIRVLKTEKAAKVF